MWRVCAACVRRVYGARHEAQAWAVAVNASFGDLFEPSSTASFSVIEASADEVGAAVDLDSLLSLGGMREAPNNCFLHSDNTRGRVRASRSTSASARLGGVHGGAVRGRALAASSLDAAWRGGPCLLTGCMWYHPHAMATSAAASAATSAAGSRSTFDQPACLPHRSSGESQLRECHRMLSSLRAREWIREMVTAGLAALGIHDAAQRLVGVHLRGSDADIARDVRGSDAERGTSLLELARGRRLLEDAPRSRNGTSAPTAGGCSPPELLAQRAVSAVVDLDRQHAAGSVGGAVTVKPGNTPPRTDDTKAPFAVYVATGSQHLLTRFRQAFQAEARRLASEKGAPARAAAASRMVSMVPILSTASLMTHERLQSVRAPRHIIAAENRRELSVMVDLWALSSSRILLRYPGTSFSELAAGLHHRPTVNDVLNTTRGATCALSSGVEGWGCRDGSKGSAVCHPSLDDVCLPSMLSAAQATWPTGFCPTV